MKLKATYSAVKLAVGTTAARVAASVSAIRLAVGTSPVALQVRASAKRLTATASAIRLLATTSAIRVAVELGAFLQKLGLQDSAVYADLVAWALNRAASDAVSAGSVSTKAFERGVDNMAAFSDGDQSYFAEVYVLNEFGRQDYALNTTVPKDVGKVVADEVLVSFAITTEKIFGRLLSDTAATADAHVSSTSKATADGSLASDSAATTVVGKTLVDTLQVSAVAEALLIVSRVVADDMSAADASVVVPTKVASDPVLAVGSATTEVSKTVADTTNVAGVSAVRFERSITDTIAVTDTLSTGLSSAKEYDSASAVSDAARASVEKLINDAVAATASAVTGILTTEESATPTYAADSAAKGIGPNRNDSATTADSGSVRSQGYVDFTYMAEDYVGSYETF